MFRAILFSCLSLSGALAFGQAFSPPYQPAVPPPAIYGGYGDYPYPYPYPYGGGTAAGSALHGLASTISARGDYNLSTSAAAINMTQAQRNAIENRKKWTETYFEMRAMNRAARAEEEGPPPSKEQLARISAARAPKPLSASEVDPVSGRIVWPELLLGEQFGPERAAVEELIVKRAHYGSLGISGASRAGSAIENMSGKLQQQVRSLPPQQYAASKSFLRSLMFDMTKSPLN